LPACGCCCCFWQAAKARTIRQLTTGKRIMPHQQP
jgi:hypothetical protein